MEDRGIPDTLSMFCQRWRVGKGLLDHFNFSFSIFTTKHNLKFKCGHNPFDSIGVLFQYFKCLLCAKHWLEMYN